MAVTGSLSAGCRPATAAPPVVWVRRRPAPMTAPRRLIRAGPPRALGGVVTPAGFPETRRRRTRRSCVRTEGSESGEQPLTRPLTTPCPGSRIAAGTGSESGGLGSREGSGPGARDDAGGLSGSPGYPLYGAASCELALMFLWTTTGGSEHAYRPLRADRPRHHGPRRFPRAGPGPHQGGDDLSTQRGRRPQRP